MVKQNDGYWAKFWSEYQFDVEIIDEQSQVFRTRDRVPITPDAWKYTVEVVENLLDFKRSDTLLDICCGNGLFSDAYSHLIEKVWAVDISTQLIDTLKSKNIANVEAFAEDIRSVSFVEPTFSKVLWYAGIQYLTEPEIVNFMKKLKRNQRFLNSIRYQS